jgi:hypothetical protein
MILHPHGPLHDRLAAYDIAQQYSSTIFVSLCFHSRKDKSGAFIKRCFFLFFPFKIA